MMQKRRLILLFFSFFPTVLFGLQITGNVYDERTGEPVEFAAVYISGTTVGSITDIDGYFCLNTSVFAREIIVSHLNYKLQVIELSEDELSGIIIRLTRRLFDITELSVSGSSRREENLAFFCESFLGTDYWGKHAEILNDSVLRFTIEYDTIVGGEKKLHYLNVRSSAPLLISLPKLGYILRYDLVNFEMKHDTVLGTKVIHTLGYFYYKAQTPGSRVKANQYNRERRRAYYNSPQHFIRSLYNGELLQNGFLIYDRSIKDYVFKINYKPFQFDSCNCLSYRGNEAVIMGLKDRSLRIHYYGYDKGPINLLRSTSLPAPSLSWILILDDECTIRSDGTLPGGGDIVFTGDIAGKRIGANLPNDYHPYVSVEQPKKQDPKDMQKRFIKKGKI